MTKKHLALLGAALVPALALALTAGAACVSQRPVEAGLVDGRLRPCPDSPNCVCSEAGEGESAIEPFAFEGDPDRAFRSLLDFVASEPRTRVVRVEGDWAHLVFFTRFLHFADDLELRLDRDARVIQVRSASRVGYSDLGTNRERVEELRRRWMPPGADDAAD
jgi:uncharacterized protein (DUF1499 family)